MYGSFIGNLTGGAYFLYFQIIGILLISLFFRSEKFYLRLLFGSVAGSLLLTWLPVLFAFFTDFTLTAHLLALFITLPVWYFAYKERALSFFTFKNYSLSERKASLQLHLPFFAAFTLTMSFWCFLLYTHTLRPDASGGLSTGQCTYGDMNMHLGFITSLAGQASFPPDYSIFPGVKLSYPFLSDSISSSLLVLGASLRFAYILPMVFAMAQIFGTVYLFARRLFFSVSKALLTLVFFFCNGGFGFVFFINWTKEQTYCFSDIFTGFYTTPTNLTERNIRWVNLIADMLLPQRATLFGYAVLLPALFLLYLSVFENHRKYFTPAGLFVAALPMIHTHSFLSAGIISGAWMLLWLRERLHTVDNTCYSLETSVDAQADCGFHASKWPHTPLLAWSALGFVFLMCLVQTLVQRSLISSDSLMFLCLSGIVTVVIYWVYLLSRYLRRFGWKELVSSWGIYLLLILLFALPQLFYWTFGQVAEGGFVRGYFNWGNQGDFYPWFYLKNIGIVLFPIIGGLCACRRKTARLYLPALLLWWLSELVVFTPNTYDNNKILYVAYLLLCMAAADYAVEFYRKLKNIPGCRVFSGLFLFLSVFSAVLTLGREAVSDYQLYSPAQTALAVYIEENTPADAVFLTDTRHNNEISSLTGRNIVCGSDAFLFYHGLDTSDRKRDLYLMYEAPLEHPELFETYQISYVVLSVYERSNYSVDEAAFRDNFTEVFSCGDTILYRVP